MRAKKLTTRIKIRKYQDGRVTYTPQVKRNFKDLVYDNWQYYIISFTCLLPISLIICYFLSLTYYNIERIHSDESELLVFRNIEAAKARIDNLIRHHNSQQKRIAEKKRSKTKIEETNQYYP